MPNLSSTARVEQEEDLLDVELDYEEDVQELPPAASNTEEASSSRKRTRRARPKPSGTEDEEGPTAKKVRSLTPKVVLRSLQVSEAHREDDTKKMFYAIMDALDDQRKRQQRLEDQQERIETMLNALLKDRQKDLSACPKVLPTRHCEVCYMAGHQAADCRNKSKMDTAHVEHLYKKKGLCKKCHCIHL